jgi:branched-subunit amino acid transport protein
MNIEGVLIGITAFIIIGVFHPIVIKTEYYFGKKAWPVFLIAGLVFIIFALLISNLVISAIAGITGFTSLWSIHELIEQEERVKKGWFPSNPNKKSE